MKDKPDLLVPDLTKAGQLLQAAKQSIADKLAAGYVEERIPCEKGYKIKLVKK